jgi:hypothetical protein
MAGRNEISALLTLVSSPSALFDLLLELKLTAQKKKDLIAFLRGF